MRLREMRAGPTGDVIGVGKFSGSIACQPTVITSQSGADGFIGKLNQRSGSSSARRARPSATAASETSRTRIVTPVVLHGDANAGPEYLAHRLLDYADTGHQPASIAPRLLASASTDTLHRLVLATDGAHELRPPQAGRDRLAALFDDGQVARRPALLDARLKALAAEPGVLCAAVALVAFMATRPRSAQFPYLSLIATCAGSRAAGVCRRCFLGCPPLVLIADDECCFS